MGSAPSEKEKSKVAKKPVKKVIKKEKQDTISRFFQNYSENPHLQQIENGYLKYLQA